MISLVRYILFYPSVLPICSEGTMYVSLLKLRVSSAWNLGTVIGLNNCLVVRDLGLLLFSIIGNWLIYPSVTRNGRHSYFAAIAKSFRSSVQCRVDDLSACYNSERETLDI